MNLQATSQPVNVVFFGNERLATGVTSSLPILKMLIKNNYNVVCIVTNHTPPTSRRQKQPEVIDFAQSYNIPLYTPEKLTDIRDMLLETQPMIGVLAAYGRMVPQSIIDVFPLGIVNIHPSALPRHRGPTPIESVMLSGDSETAVSVMKLVKAMDAGPVYIQEHLTLLGNEEKQQLADTCGEIGATLLETNLPGIIHGQLVPLDQDETGATYDTLISKDSARISWDKSATKLYNEIRAYAIWPGSQTSLHNIDVQITKVRVIDHQGTPGEIFKPTKNTLAVYCGEQALEILELKPNGKGLMSGAAFLAGYYQKRP